MAFASYCAILTSSLTYLGFLPPPVYYQLWFKNYPNQWTGKKNLTMKCNDLLLWFFSVSELVYQTRKVLLSVRAFLQWKHLDSDISFIFKLADTEHLTSACCLDSQGMARQCWAVTQSCSGPTAHLYSCVDVTSKRSDACFREKSKLKISSWLVFLLNKAAVQSWYCERGRRKEGGEDK